jgi:hypothetical protein
VVLVSGLRGSAQEWNTTESKATPPAPPVFGEVAKTVLTWDGARLLRSDGVLVWSHTMQAIWALASVRLRPTQSEAEAEVDGRRCWPVAPGGEQPRRTSAGSVIDG